MTKVVRPCIRRSKACWIKCSVSVSTEAVASSRIRMRGSISRARAMAMRCFCPPERVTPRSPTQGVVAFGHRQDEIVGLGSFGGFDDLFLAGVGAAKGDVLADGAGEQGLPAGRSRSGVRSDCRVSLADIVAIDQDRARRSDRRSAGSG